MVTSLEVMRGWWRSLAQGVSHGRVAGPLHKGLGHREKKHHHFHPKRGWPLAAVLRKGLKVVTLLAEGPFLEAWRPRLESSSCCAFFQGVKLSKTLSQDSQYHQKTPPDLPRGDGADYHLRGEELEEQMGPKPSACGE